MTVHSTRSIQAALVKKGFQQDKTHHLMYWLLARERKTGIRTRISHGAREYGEQLLSLMARDMCLRRRELDDFIRCPMSKDDYLQLLVARGILTD